MLSSGSNIEPSYDILADHPVDKAIAVSIFTVADVGIRMDGSPACVHDVDRPTGPIQPIEKRARFGDDLDTPDLFQWIRIHVHRTRIRLIQEDSVVHDCQVARPQTLMGQVLKRSRAPQAECEVS